jgi:hypothetical protein
VRDKVSSSYAGARRSAPMTREERVHGLKSLLLKFWWLAVMVIPAPWLRLHSGEQYILALVLLAVAGAFAILPGTRALLFGEASIKWPYMVHLGAVSSVLFLAAAPASFRLAIANFQEQPYLLVTTAVGTAMGMVYLVAAVFHWTSRRGQPDTSLERTRGE